MADDVRRGWIFGACLVLFSSAVVLVAEIVAARAIAPYVGLTLETFSAVIGCVLAGISAGAWIGGRLADRVPIRTLLTAALGVGGAALVASPAIVRVVGPHATPSASSGALLLTASAFLLPSIALSMVTPAVLKSLGQGSTRLGSVAGAISAIGTFGALVGNFGAGFVLVGALRSSEILVACGAGCLVLAGVTAFFYGNGQAARTPARTTAALVLVVAGVAGTQVERPLPCDAETKYVCLKIAQRGTRFIFRSNIYAQSLTNAADPTDLAYDYVRDVREVVEATIAPARADVAFGYIGGGGYTLPLYFEATYPSSSHTVYEIDGELVDQVMTKLGIADRATRFPTRVGDARTTLLTTKPRTLDVVVGDAFSGLAVPYHLTTREFLSDIHSVLRPGGIYVMNVIDHHRFDFARAEARTFQRVFKDVAMVVPSAARAGDDQPAANLLLIGADDLPAVNALNDALALSDGRTVALVGDELAAFIGDGIELTDAFAPVDQLIGNP